MQFLFFMEYHVWRHFPERIKSLLYIEIMTIKKLNLMGRRCKQQNVKGSKSISTMGGGEWRQFSHRAEYFKQEVGGVRNRIPKWDHSVPLNGKKERYFSGEDKWHDLPSKIMHLQRVWSFIKGALLTSLGLVTSGTSCGDRYVKKWESRTVPASQQRGMLLGSSIRS